MKKASFHLLTCSPTDRSFIWSVCQGMLRDCCVDKEEYFLGNLVRNLLGLQFENVEARSIILRFFYFIFVESNYRNSVQLSYF